MMLNIFHQLLKKIDGGTHIFQWLKTIIRAKFKGVHVKVGITKSLEYANRTILLDQHFCAIPFYLTLKIFKEYSEVK